MEEGAAGSSGSPDNPDGGSAEQDDSDKGGAEGLLQIVPAREPEMFLPIANISRIMRQILPANAKIAKEAKECVQECVTEFIGFITSEANDVCLKEKRKTLSGDDVICAMKILGFDNYVELLKVYLHRYSEIESDIRITTGTGSAELHTDDEGSSDSLSKVQVHLFLSL
ncbi:hypothetical protein L7F22_055089 [Adiantum nelumboides]|nr:hypothetical protein [Adiantum nelumboides]